MYSSSNELRNTYRYDKWKFVFVVNGYFLLEYIFKHIGDSQNFDVAQH